MPIDKDDLLTNIEQFKMGLISRATGGSYDDSEYVQMREYLLSRKDLADMLPQFIKSYRNTDEFWEYIKFKFGSYAERRRYLSEEINPLIDYFESEKTSKDIIKSNTDAYEIGEKIGFGGYGKVYKYWHKQLEMNFAIKFLDPAFVPEDEKIEYHRRFFREAKMLFSFNNEYIVRFYDTGLMGSTPFIKMEYVDGLNINDFMKKYGTLTFTKSITPIRHILEGLSYAHSKGVIHRDIKPNNILFDSHSKIFKIIDFGIGAYLEPDLYTKLTKTGEYIAGGAYTDPELHKDPTLKDKRSDIYSVGAIWYNLLTGASPRGSDMREVLLQIPGIDSQKSDIILKCLASINSRYNSCKEVLDAISRY